mgnify:CR=1 FL=1
MINAAQLIGTHNILLMTLDTLRLDVANAALAQGQTPNLAQHLPDQQWEARHTPGSFTYAAHRAFFAGFLPTPIAPGSHPRLFSARFLGSETTTKETAVFDAPDIVTGLNQSGYHTICIGGVGFFNKATPLGNDLPSLFDESHWSENMGVTSPTSTYWQVQTVVSRLQQIPLTTRVFLFINISAMHQPNCIFLPDATEDSPASQQAALAYADSQLPPLFAALQSRAPTLTIICSDHGTMYGEDGYTGHRLGHEIVWTVPYTQFILPKQVKE